MWRRNLYQPLCGILSENKPSLIFYFHWTWKNLEISRCTWSGNEPMSVSPTPWANENRCSNWAKWMTELTCFDSFQWFSVWRKYLVWSWSNKPRRRASASMTASTGGGSMAFIMNWPIGPSLNNFIDRHSSCRGVRNISGVVCCSSLHTKPTRDTFLNTNE